MTQQYDNVYCVASQGHTILNQGLFEESATQEYELGHTLRLNDGRTFKYAKAGAAIGAGLLCQSNVANSHADVTAMAITEDGTTGGAIGDKTLTLTLNGSTVTLAVNDATGGWVIISDDTGEGHMYKVSGNTAAVAGGSTTITLQDPLRVAVDADSTADLVINPYLGVHKHPSPATALVVGVAPMAVTSDYYFWLQTYGICSCLLDAALVVGDMCAPGQDTDGSVAPYDTSGAVDDIIVGHCMRVGVDTEYAPIRLILEP